MRNKPQKAHIKGMGLQDLLLAPIYIIVLSLLAYIVRPYVTTKSTRRFFFPALWARFAGAIALGMVYQFYYGGGDTFNYFSQSKWVYRAFLDSPMVGLRLLFESGGDSRVAETFNYTQYIWYYDDPHSFTVVKIAGFFDLFTFHTYTATALLFSTVSFSGLWALFSVVSKKYKDSVGWLALAILFVPSVVFWGSGILKDTITIGALGWLTFAAFQMIEFRKRSPLYWFIALIAIFVIFSIKIYILICFLPMVFIWLYWKSVVGTRNAVLRLLVAPVFLVFFGGAGFFALNRISAESSRYSLDKIAEQAAITAYDIRYGWGARSGGDGGYDLGELDGSWGSMVRLMPQAINVSLFRPYLWEVKNPMMALAALESLITLGLTVWFFLIKRKFSVVFGDPFLVFCLFFALVFAFAVGISTFNFGTLMRYKIPMVPFYYIVLVMNRRKV